MIGENLTTYPNLEVISAKTAEGLQSSLKAIRIPHKIITIYGEGGRHYAWVQFSRPVKIKKQEK